MRIKSEQFHLELTEFVKNHLLKSNSISFLSQGQSMSPILREGDEILVERIPFERIRFGDVIIYQKNEAFITHRFLYSKKIRPVKFS